MFREVEKYDLVPGIEECIMNTSKPEENMPVHVTTDEGVIVRPNEICENSSELRYLKKYADADTSVYNIVLNALKNLYTLYKPTIQKMHGIVIEINYKITGYMRVIPIVEHKDD